MNSIGAKLDLAARFHESRGERHMAGFLRGQLATLRNIVDHRRDYLVASYYAPGELLELFEVEVVFMERLAGFAAACNIVNSPVSVSLTKGFPMRGCSYQALFDLLITEGMIGKPAGFIALSHACSDVWMYCRAAAEKYQVPFFFLDAPRALSAQSRDSLAQQLEELYMELKKTYREKRTIAEVVAASNEARRIKSEIDCLRIENPGSYSVIDLFKLFPVYNDLGKKNTVTILQQYKAGLEAAKNRNPRELEPRILWLGMIPLHHNRLVSDIEKRLQCRIVAEEMFDFNNLKLTRERFFEDLAQGIVTSRFYSPENRMKAIIDIIKAYDIQGIVHFSQRNCRFLPPTVPVIRRKVAEHQIPIVELQGDVIDPGCYDEKRIWEQLEVFAEQIHPGRIH